MEQVMGWQRRMMRIITSIEWISLAVAITVSMSTSDEPVAALGAAGLSGLWVLTVTAIPNAPTWRGLAVDAVSLSGVVLTMLSVALTGGASSVFIVVALTPVVRASALGGRRTGIGTGLLAGGLIFAVGLANVGGRLSALNPSTILLMLLFPALGAAVAQVRVLLVDLSLQAEAAAADSNEAARRAERLESAHALLEQLADVAGSNQLNIVEISHETLKTLDARYPNSSSTAVLFGETGPVVVATHGDQRDDGVPATIPLVVSGRETGLVRIVTDSPLGPSDIDLLTASLRPLALAFSNTMLLQNITRDAVREERIRVARELHDEIGPTVASLGLALDVALLEGVENRDLSRHLSSLRDQVGRIVDEVRSAVTDLRSPDSSSLRSYIDSLRPLLNEAFTIHFDVDERRPARPSIAPDVHGIVGEAIRNSERHSGESSVRVKGWIDFDRGWLSIEDDGRGYDPDSVTTDRFGLVGAQERADRSELLLDLHRSDRGTRVTVEWGQSS